MLSLLSSLLIAQTPYPLSLRDSDQRIVAQPQEIRPLPGKLNDVMVFNSNSPEVIYREGILLSTFPEEGKRFPNAHLNKPLQGRFDVFSHHIARPYDSRTLYQGILVNNPTSKTVIIKVLQGATYLTSPDAPFVNLPPVIEDPRGQFYSGPGSRLMSDILRGVSDPELPSRIVIPPYQSRMLFNLPIPTSNARSTFIRLYSDGPVYMANLAQFEVVELPKITNIGDKKPAIPPAPKRRAPDLNDWKRLLILGSLATPRDLQPTPPDQVARVEKVIYGRVAGISVGSEWIARLTDRPGKQELTIPPQGKAFSYPLSTVTTGTHGTQQIQSAPMLVRYSDTAYRAHGNYGVHYNLTLPMVNNTNKNQTVAISLQTPLKQNEYADRLFFGQPPEDAVFFRGAVRLSYANPQGQTQEKYFHLVQRRGQKGEPLMRLNLAPGERREVTLDFLYPPDATPPQVLTIETMQLFYGGLQ